MKSVESHCRLLQRRIFMKISIGTVAHPLIGHLLWACHFLRAIR